MVFAKYETAEGDALPENALVVGHESGNSPLYGVRAAYEGCIIPGKISSGSKHAVIGKDCREYYKTDYEAVCIDPESVEWISASDGRVPSNAIPVGKNSNGGTLYMGRAHYEGALIPGKIDENLGCLLITHNEREIEINQYEALTYKNPDIRKSIKLSPGSSGFIPDDALVVGHNSDESKLYGVRAAHNGCIIPGKISPGSKHAVVGRDWDEHLKDDYEVLCINPNLVEWVRDSNGRVPWNAIPVGNHFNGETLYMGRAHYKGGLIPGKVQGSWACLFITHNQKEIGLHSNYEVLTLKNAESLELVSFVPESDGSVPENALVVGHESDDTSLYGIRATDNECIIPGKLSSGSKNAVIGRDSNEYLKNDYEVICIDSHRVQWVHDSYGKVPFNAIPIGKRFNGETLFMGRAYYEGALIPGNIQKSSRCLFITHNQQEIPIYHYEVLTFNME